MVTVRTFNTIADERLTAFLPTIPADKLTFSLGKLMGPVRAINTGSGGWSGTFHATKLTDELHILNGFQHDDGHSALLGWG